MDQSRISEVKHLYEVEHLTIRQISRTLRMCTKTVARIVKGEERKRRSSPPAPYDPFMRIIAEWYSRHPSLMAFQIYERLKSYGYEGSYRSICRVTERYRKKRREVYHELTFLPGVEAQVDWMEAKLPFGKAYGFVYILAYSRYLFLKFYPRSSMEFFLDGHMEAIKEIGGIARRHRYDNLKSVVTARKPELTLNARFVDFARHYGFSIHVCNPGRGNEKGRVERAIRDIRSFVETTDFTSIADLNRKTTIWRKERNGRIHRSTGKPPTDLLKEENLMPCPAIPYTPYRVIPSIVTSTAFVIFETNRYSVPSEYGGMAATILAYPDHIEVLVKEKKVAHHARSFERNGKIEHPSHRETLLNRTPHFKYERIRSLMTRMDPSIARFVERAEADGEDPLTVAYGLFRLLKMSTKEMLFSAVREANSLGVSRLRYVESLLTPRKERAYEVYPQNTKLLDITYEKRELAEYDELV